MARATPRFTVLLFFFVTFLSWVSALSLSERRETNADRLARGLSPLQPQSLRRGPSGTTSAKRSSVSPRPPVTVCGRLQVRSRLTGTSNGFVKNWSGGAPISGINFLSGFQPDLEVSITYSPSSLTRLNMLVTNPQFPAPFYVGASSGNGILTPGVRSGLGFTNVQQTPPGPPTNNVGSAIWSFNPSSRKLQAFWVNPDSTVVEAVLAYEIRANALFFVSDINAWNAGATFPASAVDLFLTPS